MRRPRSQLKGFEDDVEKMAKLMESYSEFFGQGGAGIPAGAGYSRAAGPESMAVACRLREIWGFPRKGIRFYYGCKCESPGLADILSDLRSVSRQMDQAAQELKQMQGCGHGAVCLQAGGAGG